MYFNIEFSLRTDIHVLKEYWLNFLDNVPSQDYISEQRPFGPTALRQISQIITSIDLS